MNHKSRPTARPSKSAAIHRPQTIRIIGGQWKRSTLNVRAADGLRPTPDRVRETLFNWLQHIFHGNWHNLSCLDLFAGSGALGLEAASRGAAAITLVETSMVAITELHAACEKLNAQQVSVLQQDALLAAQRWALDPTTRFDLIFLDPPYGQNWLAQLLPLCATLLAPGGVLYAEAEMSLANSALLENSAWQIIRSTRAGQVFAHLLQHREIDFVKA